MKATIRKPWRPAERRLTPPEVYRARALHRRAFLQHAGLAAGAALWAGFSGCGRPSDAEIEQAGAVAPLPESIGERYPAPRDSRFEYNRPETAQRAAAEYTNFYEFSSGKDSWRHVDRFEPTPWAVEVDGLCAKPRTFDLDDIYRRFTLQERAYRHRCVERWAMCIPWTGLPLRALLEKVEPKPAAKFVAFQTFNRPKEAPQMRRSIYPWPYTEGLTIAEAANELTLLATGIYGEPLPKQHGAPIRLVVPWKYGFKSIKSIVRITLTEREPATFWNTVAPHEYGFRANVNPEVPHPRWSQKTEWMLGTGETYPTKRYNGYGEYVGGLYRG